MKTEKTKETERREQTRRELNLLSACLYASNEMIEKANNSSEDDSEFSECVEYYKSGFASISECMEYVDPNHVKYSNANEYIESQLTKAQNLLINKIDDYFLNSNNRKYITDEQIAQLEQCLLTNLKNSDTVESMRNRLKLDKTNYYDWKDLLFNSISDLSFKLQSKLYKVDKDDINELNRLLKLSNALAGLTAEILESLIN